MTMLFCCKYWWSDFTICIDLHGWNLAEQLQPVKELMSVLFFMQATLVKYIQRQVLTLKEVV